MSLNNSDQTPLLSNKTAKISLFGLVMLMTGAVDGVSNLPSIAIFGEQLVFFFIVASLLFLLPTGLVSAELCKQFPNEGGVYVWSNKALGGSFAAFTIWLQWINTMVWFPTCLTTLVGTLAYLINPALSHHPVYLVTASLSVFWMMTLLNLTGVKNSSKIAALATTFGMILPMLLIIGLSIAWLMFEKPLAIHLTHAAILPHLTSEGTWTSLTAIITSFLGMELATAHVKKIKNAQHVFPKALMIAIGIIILTMGFGSLSVAMVIPHHNIVLVTGSIQAFQAIFVGFHVQWLEYVLGVMLLFGSLGAMVNWLISPAAGLAETANNNYLPKKLAAENKHGVPSKILLAQAVVVTLISSAFFLMPSINGSYWLLLDLSTELYVAMYVLMFIAAFVILSKSEKIFVIPGGKKIAMAICVLGLIGCIITFIVGFFPPSNVNVGSHWHYISLFSGGFLLMCSPAILLKYYYQYQKKLKLFEKAGKNILLAK